MPLKEKNIVKDLVRLLKKHALKELVITVTEHHVELDYQRVKSQGNSRIMMDDIISQDEALINKHLEMFHGI